MKMKTAVSNFLKFLKGKKQENERIFSKCSIIALILDAAGLSTKMSKGVSVWWSMRTEGNPFFVRCPFHEKILDPNNSLGNFNSKLQEFVLHLSSNAVETTKYRHNVTVV